MTEAKVFPIKTRLVKVTSKKNGVQYIEERQYQYNPKKRQNILISTRRTGMKIVKPGTEPVPCRPKKPAAEKKAETPVTAKRVRTRSTDLMNHAGKVFRIDRNARTAYPNGGTSDKLISVGRFLVATGKAVNQIESYQLSHDLPYSEGISEDVCYNLFEELGQDESGMQSLFMQFASMAGNDRQQAIAFDTTSHSTYSRGLRPYVRQGFNKDGDGLDIYKVASFFSLDSGLPVSFEMQMGNISDVKSLVNAVKRAHIYGLHNPELVLDNGFFSRENVCEMLRGNVKFTVLGTLTDTWVYRHLDLPGEDGRSLRQSMDDYASQCPFDVGVRGVSTFEMTNFSWKRRRSRGDKKAGVLESQEFRLYFHYFRNELRAMTQEVSFRERLQRVERRLVEEVELSDSDQRFADKYFTCRHVRGGRLHVAPKEDEIRDASRDFGIFVLVTNIHTERWEALRRYRQRNVIEESYRVVKTDLDGKRPRVWSIESLRGKEICRHIALAYQFALQRILNWVKEEAGRRRKDETYPTAERDIYGKVADWLAESTLEEVLDWFDCVEDVTVKNKIAQKRWSGETTKRDEAFLNLFYEKTDWV